jgi:hypothetical protein
MEGETVFGCGLSSLRVYILNGSVSGRWKVTSLIAIEKAYPQGELKGGKEVNS